MSGVPTAGARAPAAAKTREEMLQEWREQRAAKLASQPSNGKSFPSESTFNRMPVGPSGGKENRPGPMQAPKPVKDAHTAAGTDGFSSLAARLESLKRESLRPSIAPPSSAPSQCGVQFETAGPVDTTVLRRLASQLFEDESWNQLYEKGMNAQLTRSKDGATEGTKIKELAGMVKLLRRALKELQSRTESFVEQSCRFERDIGQQVEAAKLSSESGTTAAQAELANARREAAAATAAHKNALAQWKGEMDTHQAENARLKREGERLQAEISRLTSELRRSESQRVEVQEVVQQAQRASATAAKEAATKQATLERALRDLRAAHESSQLAARQELEKANATLTERDRALTESKALQSALQRELTAAKDERESLRASLATTTCRCSEAESNLDEQKAVHERVVADAAAVLNELQDWQAKAGGLSSELSREREQGRAVRLELQQHKTMLEDASTKMKGLETEVLIREEARMVMEKQCHEARHDAEQLRLKQQDLMSEKEQLACKVKELETVCAEQSSKLAVLEQTLQERGSQIEHLETSRDEALRSLDASQHAAQVTAGRLERLESELAALQECTVGLAGDSGDDAREMVSRLLHRVGTLESAIAESEARRRSLHNSLVELKGNIRVFCRVRPPMHQSSGQQPVGSVITCLADGTAVRVEENSGREHDFRFDKIFRPDSSQASVYAEVSDLVQSALDGYKVCLFSYGQTGAGKTHTMQGSSQRGEGAGIIPRAARQILDAAARLREQGWEYVLEATFVEVYNETLRDLLVGKGARLPDANAIQHQPNGGHTVVAGATRMSIGNEDDVAAVLARAAASRSVESTAMNATSSRSHSVFMLNITGQHAGSDTVLHGSLSLVDLAGSERLARSQAEGARAKEACNINKSLSALGDVFQALATRSAHIPYRNSKLTHLLQPCLGGSGKTLMFVNVNPDPASTGETLCSLRFAAKVNGVDTAAKGGATRHVGSLSTEGGGVHPGRTALESSSAKRKAGPSASRIVRPRG